MIFKIETLAIGDELLTGRIADTNSAFVADRCYQLGLRLDRCNVLADDEAQICQVIGEVAARSRVAICFGGLGPTSDDKTAEVVARLLGTTLETHQPSLEHLKQWYRENNRTLNPHSHKQVLYPKGTGVLANGNGMAPGFTCRIKSCEFFFLPGVPREMKLMFETGVLPILKKALQVAGAGTAMRTHTWRLVGIPESEVQVVMDPIETSLGALGFLGYRTKFPENYLTLYYRGGGPESPDRFSEFQAEIRERLGPWCYTETNLELEEVVVALLKERRARLVLAESCTGGALAARLTRVPGASEVIWGGVTVYQTDAKQKLLHLTIPNAEYTVSAACSAAIALKAQAIAGVEYSVGVTGYLGPGGGTAADPVGTVFYHVLGISEAKGRINLPRRERLEMQWGATTHVLDALRRVLQKETS